MTEPSAAPVMVEDVLDKVRRRFVNCISHSSLERQMLNICFQRVSQSRHDYRIVFPPLLL